MEYYHRDYKGDDDLSRPLVASPAEQFSAYTVCVSLMLGLFVLLAQGITGALLMNDNMKTPCEYCNGDGEYEGQIGGDGFAVADVMLVCMDCKGSGTEGGD